MRLHTSLQRQVRLGGTLSSLALAAIVSACAGLRVDLPLRTGPNDWTMFGGSGERANATSATVRLPLAERWQYNSTAGIAATPLVRDSVVLICTQNGELQAVNFVNGKRLGYTTLESSVMATPAMDGTIVYIPLSSAKESMIAYDIRDGRKIWSQKNLGPLESSPLLMDNALFVSTLGGSLVRLSKETGEEIWTCNPRPKEERKPFRSSPASDGERVFVGNDDGTLYAVEKKDGSLAWKFPTPRSIFASPAICGAFVVIGSTDGIVYALDRATGKVGWQFDTGAPIYASAASNGVTAFVGSSNGSLFALETQHGGLLWKFTAKSAISCAALVSGQTLFVGSLDRSVYGLEIATGTEMWKFTAVGRVRVSPVVWGNSLLVTSEDKFLTCLKPELAIE